MDTTNTSTTAVADNNGNTETNAVSTVEQLQVELQKEKAAREAVEKAYKAHADEVAKLRVERAAEQAHSNVKANIGTAGQEAIALEKAIQAVGGRAYWSKLTAAQKAAALGVDDSEQVKDVELKRYFGPTSSGSAANALMCSSPAVYRKYKRIAQTRGII